MPVYIQSGSLRVCRVPEAVSPIRAPRNVVSQGEGKQDKEPEERARNDQLGHSRTPPGVHEKQSDEAGFNSCYREGYNEIQHAQVDKRYTISDDREHDQSREYY